MRIDIAEVQTVGRQIGGVAADAASYARAADATMRQAASSGSGFASISLLPQVLDRLRGRLDEILADSGEVARDVGSAAQAHAGAEERSRSAMEGLVGQLPGRTPGEDLMCLAPSSSDPATVNPLRDVLNSNGPAVELAGSGGAMTPMASPAAGPAPGPPLGPLDSAVNNTRFGVARFGNLANWMANVENGRFAPRAANGQFVSPASQTAWQRAMSGANAEFRATPNRSGTRAAWLRAQSLAGRATAGLSVAASTAEQAATDWKDPSLTGDERVARAGWRGATEGGGLWAGGAVGAKAGAAAGTLAWPGVGTVVGGAVGGFAGAVAGSELGGVIADHTVDAVGRIFEKITPW